jgi:hypothetical protein
MLDEGDGGIHLRPPHDEGFVKRHSRLLQIGDVRIPDVILGSDLVEVLCEGCFLAREALLELGAQLCHLLDVGIHGTKLGLLTTCVMDGFQDGAGSRLLIPLVSSCRRDWKEKGDLGLRTESRYHFIRPSRPRARYTHCGPITVALTFLGRPQQCANSGTELVRGGERRAQECAATGLKCVLIRPFHVGLRYLLERTAPACQKKRRYEFACGTAKDGPRPATSPCVSSPQCIFLCRGPCATNMQKKGISTCCCASL